MKRKRIQSGHLKDEEGDEDRDRRNSLRRKRRIRYAEEEEDDDDDNDEEEDEDEEDEEDNEQPGTSTQNTQNQGPQDNGLLPVTCGDKKGMLDVEKLDRGEECIRCEGRWFAPPAFEDFGGKGSSKKWKMTIFHEDKPLQNLFENGTLTTKGYKRRGSETTKPKTILSSNLDSDATSEGSEALALETEEEGEEERVGAENGGELVDSGDDERKEEGDEMEKGEMENDDKPALPYDSDNSVSEERKTKLIISPLLKNALQTVKIVIQRLKVAKSDCQSKCMQHPEEDGGCKPVGEDEQSEERERGRQHNGSAIEDPSVAHSDPWHLSDGLSIVESEKATQTDGGKKELIKIKTEKAHSPTPSPEPATSPPDIQSDIVSNTEDNGSISNHSADLSTPPVPLVSVTSTNFADDVIEAGWQEKGDGEWETDHCGKKETKWKRQEHVDMPSFETSDQLFATRNITDVGSNTVTTQRGINNKNIAAMSLPTKPPSVPVECKNGNPEHTDATTYGHDVAQLQVMTLETRDSSDKEGPSPRPSASVNLDIMNLDQLKREKIKMQLKVLKLQEEYYTLKMKEFKKGNCFTQD